jgi:hypothetical protein
MLFSIDIQPQWISLAAITPSKFAFCVIFLSTRQKCAVGLIIQGVACEASWLVSRVTPTLHPCSVDS